MPSWTCKLFCGILVLGYQGFLLRINTNKTLLGQLKVGGDTGDGFHPRGSLSLPALLLHPAPAGCCEGEEEGSSAAHDACHGHAPQADREKLPASDLSFEDS